MRKGIATTLDVERIGLVRARTRTYRHMTLRKPSGELNIQTNRVHNHDAASIDCRYEGGLAAVMARHAVARMH